MVLHEMFHNLGFWHEQNRIDRDMFVTVDWSNIQPNFYSADQEMSDALKNPLVNKTVDPHTVPCYISPELYPKLTRNVWPTR